MLKNQSITIPFYAYIASSGRPATGASGWTVYLSQDGNAPSSATNSPSEISSSYAPGIYKITLTAAEMNADTIVVTFSHASVSAQPVTITTDEPFPVIPDAPTVPTATEVADAVLSRSVSNVQSTAAEHSLATIVLAALESAISSQAWTIYQTDGQTTYLTKEIVTSANALPVIGVK